MFELIEHQPSHFSSPDVLNLTPGNVHLFGCRMNECCMNKGVLIFGDIFLFQIIMIAFVSSLTKK